ncbi:MAG TPA: PfkB family carbohydrate kinase [Chloroflexota bacterium]|jgi:sugar/nucleoside kinase (ribokinase family)|nr:PfkB family carbohydrate kinase [Chloroflexota bacterium]
MTVLVIGSIALDTLETPFGNAEEQLGGAGAYFSLAASALTAVQLVGVVGDDLPERHLETLRGRGVDLSGVQRVENGKTFRWKGKYEYDMNVAHTLDTQLNVFGDFQPNLPENYRDAEFVYLANITPSLQLGVLDQVRKPKFVGLDSMNFWIGNPDTKKDLTEVIKRVNAVFMNDAEIRQYTGKYNLFEAAREVLNLGPQVVLMKKGEHGAVAVSREGIFVAAAYPLETVKDPTGAGDSFAGGFMGHLADTGDTSWAGIKRAMIFGSVIASFAVETFGPDGLLTMGREAIHERFETLRNCTMFEALPSAVAST